MKKVIFVIVVVVLLASLWMNLRSSGRIKLSFMEGKTVPLKKGNLTIDITANGTIEPNDRIELKSEAGGVVLKTPFEVGDPVREGDLMIELDPEDEQRLVDIADKAYRQALINLGRAENTLYQRENVDLPMAQKRHEQSQIEFEYAEFQYNKTKKLEDRGQTHKDEWRRVSSNYHSLEAKVALAKIEVDRARSNIERAQLEVEQAGLAVARAKDDLADAQKRLRETRIAAPVDGMLSTLRVKKGTVIASGSASFGGGTLLGTLADMSRLYVQAEVDESDIGRVREIAPPQARPGHSEDSVALAGTPDDAVPIEVGQLVQITVDAFPEEEFAGVIELIEPEAVKIGQVVTYVVRIQLTSENSQKLFLGMQANVKFVSESVKDVVLVPNEAVRYVAGERGVYTPVDSQTTPDKKVPQFAAFRGGLDNGMYTQVISGLEVGDEVYVKLPKDRDGEEITGDDE